MTDSNIMEKLDEKIKISGLKYPIPKVANTYGYALGAITLFAFTIMGITGTILAQYYNPTPEGANQSVAYISSNWFLQYIRGLHWWTALFIPVLLLLHMLRIVITGSYKQNREITWYIGLALFLVSMVMLFTGTTLKYDQEGFEALEHFDLTGKMFGPLGIPLTSDITTSTSLLSRMYALHISTLPLLLLLLIAFHLLYIKLHGISSLPGEEETWKEETDITFLDHLKVATLYSGIFFVIVSFFAIIFPREAAPEPILGVEVSRPPWAFLPWYPIENWIGLLAIVIFPAIAVILLALIPIIDRAESRDPRVGSRKIAVAIMIGMVLFVVSFSIWAGLIEPESHF